MGNLMWKLVPSPGQESTRISPPCCWMIWCVMASPSPVPSPTGLVVKNGSKMRGQVFLRDTLAVVGHADVHRIIGMPGLDAQLSLAFHGLCRVGEEVEEHLIELRRGAGDLGRSPSSLMTSTLFLSTLRPILSALSMHSFRFTASVAAASMREKFLRLSTSSEICAMP